MNNIEQEIIILNAVNKLIDSMVNFELMLITGDDPDSNIVFKSMTHQKFFNIILVDFLSCTDPKGPIKRTSYISGLRNISDAPYFDGDDSIEQLKIATYEFKNWLEQEIDVDIWLPSIDKDITIKITRFNFLKMTGDISKHNYLRALGVAEELQNILSVSGVKIEIEEALLALSEFYERFHTDILGYHSSTIAEFLNNIRWGIYYYLQPEFRKSKESPKCRSTYPYEVCSDFAKACYCELMNEVRSEPYMRKFKVTKCLKLRY